MVEWNGLECSCLCISILKTVILTVPVVICISFDFTLRGVECRHFYLMKQYLMDSEFIMQDLGNSIEMNL